MLNIFQRLIFRHSSAVCVVVWKAIFLNYWTKIITNGNMSYKVTDFLISYIIIMIAYKTRMWYKFYHTSSVQIICSIVFQFQKASKKRKNLEVIGTLKLPLITFSAATIWLWHVPLLHRSNYSFFGSEIWAPTCWLVQSQIRYRTWKK